MIVTAETYRKAAERLRVLVLQPGTSGRVAFEATHWGYQLRGAAEALEHHTTPCLEQQRRCAERGYDEGREEIERTLTPLSEAVYEHFSLKDSPSPTWREKAEEQLEACARGLGIIS